MPHKAEIAGQPARRDLANAIRALSMDAVQAANSGHPGAPMGMADIAEVLWNDYLRHNPANPLWANRDRFVLSNGHASMLLYSLLHLTGYEDFPIEQLRNFRQLGYRTAGHPEYERGGPVETTTGPLGQGISNAVGLAMAEKMLAAEFNRKDHEIVDHKTWVFLGDGCLMEGISHEACSLAGTLKLGKLICFYDDNNISIDGEVDAWFTDDTAARFDSYGWQVIDDVDGHDGAEITAAIERAIADGDRPTIICCKTIIGFGAPHKQGTAATHGAPLGDDEVAAARKQLGWDSPPFEIPEDIAAAWDGKRQGSADEAEWNSAFAAYDAEHPELAAEFARRMADRLPQNWSEFASKAIADIDAAGESMATRKASLVALNAFAPVLPELVGGSADLTGSNLTKHSGSTPISGDDAAGNYVWFGVREFGMTAICNGLSLHGGFIPYAGTFLTFSDYARNALRMAALMKIQSILVYTHDSIGLGEDGPTHQPVEHTASLRLMPNMSVWRPCDTVETAVAWRYAIERQDGPTSLVLTRQGLPFQPRTGAQLSDIVRGGYVLKETSGTPDIIFIATGSEVALAVSAADALAAEGVEARVVSMPCTDVFDAQDAGYRASVLPAGVTRRVVIEAGVTGGWWRYAGAKGRVIGLDRFGESAPAAELFEHFGFSTDSVVAVAKDVLA
ncbi:MAG: transketolase [Gammaproteobacteria bacterium]|nr:transketolase [Gammaproteobacteria bacterium]MBT8111167.1 transketolase [Gammaproteobacteria bacterium]NND48093.1 transketolase [Woeseiaceae bacterium]NNL45865.1 transketolase [Woeseiaceae bacterium]